MEKYTVKYQVQYISNKGDWLPVSSHRLWQSARTAALKLSKRKMPKKEHRYTTRVVLLGPTVLSIFGGGKEIK